MQEKEIIMLEYEELTGKIIGAAIEVHTKLGPGFLESVYENALAIELRKRGMNFTKQEEVDIFYDDEEVGKHRLDLFIEGTIVLELKAIKNIINEHFAVVRSYLKAVKQKHGLIINFAKSKLEVKRVIREN